MRTKITRILVSILLALSICAGALADTLVLPPALEEIGEEAFAGDKSLDQVVVQEGVKIIQDAAFRDSSLKEITLPGSITTIEGDPFAGTEDLVIVTEEGGYAGKWAGSHSYSFRNDVIEGQWNGHTYRLILEGKSWEGACADCFSRGGHLATISSAGEQSFLESLISQIPETSRPFGFWLGATMENSWESWITGEDMVYGNWEEGQPDGSTGDENYILMAGRTTTDANGWTFHFGKWDDCLYPGEQFPYICETEPAEHASAGLNAEVQQVYFDFIMNGGYLKAGQDYYVPTGNFYDGQGALFALRDLDADGIPELIATNGYESHADAGGYAYTCRNGKAVYLGYVPIDEYISQLTYYPDNTKYTGLISSGGGMGYIYVQYVTIRDGKLVCEPVLSSEETSGRIRYTRETSDTELYDLVRSDQPRTSMEGFTPEWIGTNGWDAFLARFGYSNAGGFSGEIRETDPEETAFRAWAADTIASYYMDYAQHGENSAVFREHQNFEFVQFDKLRDFIFRNGQKLAQIEVNTVGLLDGLYREYYLMALYKRHYDFDGYKETFSSVKYDSESEAEYAARMKPFYTRLLLDTLTEKAEIDPGSFERLGKDTEGMFALKMNKSTGKLELVRDEDGLMANLERMADTATAEAWTNFAIAAVETGINVARAYLKIQDPSQDKYTEALTEAAVKGISKVAETVKSDLFTREKNKLENNLHEILLMEIANAKLQDYNRIIAYFENIYAGGNDTFVEYQSDGNFLEVVRGLVDAAKAARYDSALDYARNYLSEQYSNGIELKKIMSDAEIVADVAGVFVEGLIDVAAAPIKTFIKEEISEECRPVGTMLTILCDVVKAGAQELVKSKLASLFPDSEEEYDNSEFILKLSQTILKDINSAIEDAATKNDSGYDGKDAAKKFQFEVMNILIDELDEIKELISGYLENGKYLSEAQLKKIQDELWKLAEKLEDAFVKSGKKWIWSMAFNAAGGKLMESADIADKIRDFAVVAAAIDVKDGILKTAQALADANLETRKNLENEQQISYCATALYLAGKNSAPIEKWLMWDLERVMGQYGVGKTYSAIAAMIRDPEILSLKEILEYTDMIMLQTEYDLSGTQWLIQLLAQHESAKSKSKFMKNLEKQIPAFWMERMTRKTAVTEYNQMLSFRQGWLSGWKESYRNLAAQ